MVPEAFLIVETSVSMALGGGLTLRMLVAIDCTSLASSEFISGGHKVVDGLRLPSDSCIGGPGSCVKALTKAHV